MNTDPDPGVLCPKIGKNLQLKKKILWAKTIIYLSLGLHKGRPSYKRSLQLSKKNIQHFKTWNFVNFLEFFLLLWVIFALLDPDLDSEYGSGSNWDPDPQPWSFGCGYLTGTCCPSFRYCLGPAVCHQSTAQCPPFDVVFRHRRFFCEILLTYLLPSVLTTVLSTRVADPDPNWIQFQLKCWMFSFESWRLL